MVDTSTRRPPAAFDSRASRALSLLVLMAIIAALYVGKAIFIPLALAILLTFVLAPPARMLHRWGVGGMTAAVIVVLIACIVIFRIGGLLGQQLTQLAERLPEYELNITAKIQQVRGAAANSTTFERISGFLSTLDQEVSPRKEVNNPPLSAPGDKNIPTPVEIQQPTLRPIEIIQRILEPLIDPLLTSGLIVIFVTFFLVQREDLRDRKPAWLVFGLTDASNEWSTRVKDECSPGSHPYTDRAKLAARRRRSRNMSRIAREGLEVHLGQALCEGAKHLAHYAFCVPAKREARP